MTFGRLGPSEHTPRESSEEIRLPVLDWAGLWPACIFGSGRRCLFSKPRPGSAPFWRGGWRPDIPGPGGFGFLPWISRVPVIFGGLLQRLVAVFPDRRRVVEVQTWT